MITKKTVRANYTGDQLAELLLDLLMANKAPESDRYEGPELQVTMTRFGQIKNIRVEATAIFTDQ